MAPSIASTVRSMPPLECRAIVHPKLPSELQHALEKCFSYASLRFFRMRQVVFRTTSTRENKDLRVLE